MDNKNNDFKEYEVLGLKVRYRSENLDSNERVDAQDVINLANKEMNAIKTASPNLSREEWAILAALKLAQDYIAIKQEYKKSLEKMDLVSSDVLKTIEEIKLH
ncbi:MAG: cell division protein ZapA [Oligoflexia bacterium]|nr:cell division protein ZapA [Oligoflexia bacterium]